MAARLRVRVTPRSARSEIVGWREEVLRVRLTAPPAEGAANAALERLIATALRVPPTSVRVVAGLRNREKTVEIEGTTREDVLLRLAARETS
jgi:uncharacterized protein (TIGR00251 family)